jgi:hypothetical protein
MQGNKIIGLKCVEGDDFSESYQINFWVDEVVRKQVNYLKKAIDCKYSTA